MATLLHLDLGDFKRLKDDGRSPATRQALR
jgi:hypothetical protein